MEGKENTTDMAFYEVMKDSYAQRYKIRTLLFKRLLRHMLSKIKEESTIYYLMQLVKDNRGMSK
ncbi:hypothetical protein B5F13_11435 [Drancourtella sp. An177]|nr:hypothetical protein B5F13_11435 [Drancourtella sp. An177]